MQSFYLDLADAVLVLHAMIVFFIVAMVPFIWIGWARNWSVVRHPGLRWGHLLLIGFVVAESVFGVTCPLTTWENSLRVSGGAGALYSDGYIAYWLHRLMFFNFPPAVFTVFYLIFFAAVVFSFVRVKPRQPNWPVLRHWRRTQPIEGNGAGDPR